MPEKAFRPAGGRKHVVVIGSGFGGLTAVRDLAGANVDVTLIDRTNHHLFAPMLYQVATGIIGPSEIAPLTRQILSKQDNAAVVKGEVTDIDTDSRTVTASLGDYSRTFEYDSLVVAAGAGQSYFGNDQFAEFAPGMKTLDDALEIRARVLDAFERAEITEDPAERERLLTFVVIGAGPTGVELAGQFVELANRTLAGKYRNFSASSAKIILLDGAPQVLPPFGKNLGKKSQRALEKIGIDVRLNAMVTNIDDQTVTYKQNDEEISIETYTKVWSAGVAASPLGKLVAEQLGAEADRAGRVAVNDDLSVGSDKNVFLIGDMMGNGTPGVAQGAIQSGQHVARIIKAEAEGASESERKAFSYFDKGSLATLSRFSAVAKIGKAEFTGFPAWVLWLGVHIAYIKGFRNNIFTVIQWLLYIVSRKRWSMDTSRQALHARTAIEALARETGTGDDAPVEVRDNTRFAGKEKAKS